MAASGVGMMGGGAASLTTPTSTLGSCGGAVVATKAAPGLGMGGGAALATTLAVAVGAKGGMLTADMIYSGCDQVRTEAMV